MIQKLDDTCTLHNGVKMPGFGFGTWQSAAGILPSVRLRPL